MHHEEGNVGKIKEQSEEAGDSKNEENLKTVLEQQNLRDIKDAENTPPKGRFSNADLQE